MVTLNEIATWGMKRHVWIQEIGCKTGELDGIWVTEGGA